MRQVRYERLLARARPGEGVQSFEDFMVMEAKENVAKSTNQQLDATFELAQRVIDNSGTLEELHAKLEKFLEEISAKQKDKEL